MSYEIIESHLVFENGKLKEVLVLWRDGNGCRGTYSNREIGGGYYQLSEKDVFSDNLLQEIAGGGVYLDAGRKTKYFPGKRFWTK